MTQNQYTSVAKLFIELFPNDTFPLRISKQALLGLRQEGHKNIMLLKESPLVETFSVTLLRLFQTGIGEHFGFIKTSIDFSRNPNIRTDEQDWKQIITLDITKVFFLFSITSGYFTLILILPMEYYSSTKFAIILRTSLKPSLMCIDKTKDKGRKIPLISIVQCIILSFLCFGYLTYNYNGISGGISYCESMKILYSKVSI